jgi:very-short-patch-repair endonuclease
LLFKSKRIQPKGGSPIEYRLSMSEFTRNLDELLHIAGKKVNLTYHLQKNYKEHVHYIIQTITESETKKGWGGQNKKIFLLTETAFELLKNSYNMRNRYIVNVSDTVTCVNIGMCIENQTIGFIENSFKGVLECRRQYPIGSYRIDLYFPAYHLAVECDEYNHADRDPEYEKTREEYILAQGNQLIRYNPNEPHFDLSNVIRDIHKVIMCIS